MKLVIYGMLVHPLISRWIGRLMLGIDLMKSRFGEVETPPFLVKEMIGLIGEVGRERWLEVGGGKGAITQQLLN